MVRCSRSGGLVTAILCVLLAGACGGPGNDAETRPADGVEIPELNSYEFGSDFTLTDQDGRRFDTASLRGKPVLLFFGYTSCPDACPTTLSKLTRVYRLLGDRADVLQTVFVSVDPERDTPERMKEYLSYYGLPVVGLSGTAEEIDFAAGEFGVYHNVSDETTEAGPLIDHTLMVYLLDRKGTLRYLFQPGDSAEVMAGVIRKVL